MLLKILTIGYNQHLDIFQNFKNKKVMADKLAKPLGDRVLLTELDANEETTTASGIIIPDTARSEDVKRARVEAVGDGLFTQSGIAIPMSVNVGDEVILPPYHQGQEIKVGGKKYLVLRESELLMVIR
jgi:chaperonin GroES